MNARSILAILGGTALGVFLAILLGGIFVGANRSEARASDPKHSVVTTVTHYVPQGEPIVYRNANIGMTGRSTNSVQFTMPDGAEVTVYGSFSIISK